MLETAYVKIFDMSISASILILIILLLRLALKRMPKVFSYCLWAVVLLRLLCPFEISLPFGIVPKQQTFVADYTPTYEMKPYKSDASEVIAKAVDNIINGDFEPLNVDVVKEHKNYGPMSGTVAYEWWEPIFYYSRFIWLGGCLVMFAIGLIGYGKLKRKVRGSSCLRNSIYLSDGVPTPFVMGLLLPKIYLPSCLTDQEQEYIIQHEEYHIHRRDHIWKALSFLALCLHWFNPLVWVAFYVCSRDMEMSCDEAVLKKMEWSNRADYSELLLRFAVGRTIISGAPLAFGEGDTKKRIVNISKWKEHAKKTLIITSIICGVLLLCLAFPHQNGNYGFRVKAVFDSFPSYHRSTVEFKMSEYPGINFVYNEKGLFACEGDKETQLTGLMCNLFLADLNGDGYREFCRTIKVGSGIVDTRISVYDYVDGIEYNLEERQDYDYYLSGTNGCMIVNRTLYTDYDPCDQGRLILANRELTFLSGATIIPGSRITPLLNREMIENTFIYSDQVVHAYYPDLPDSGTSTGRNEAVDYYINRNIDILGNTVHINTSNVFVRHMDIQSNYDVYRYLYVIGAFAENNNAPYVYYDPELPNQLFVCSEFRDMGFKNIREYYKALLSGTAEAHSETYVIHLDKYAIYKWNSTTNLYHSFIKGLES